MWLLLIALTSDTTWTAKIPVAPAESLRVSLTGSGTPVVLLPGLFGSAFSYRRVALALAASGYQAVVIEPLGIGGSSHRSHGDYSLTAQADRVARALDALAIPHAIVVAHGVGASIALRLAYRYPDRVRGIVSLEGGAAEAATTKGFRRALRFAPWVKWFGGVGLIRRQIRSRLRAASADPSWVTDSVIAGYTADAAADLDGTLLTYLAMAASREPDRLREHLREVRCPVWLVLGAAPHTDGPPPAEIALLTSNLRLFTVDSIPGSGHFIQEERPTAVIEAVRHLDGQLASMDTATVPRGP